MFYLENQQVSCEDSIDPMGLSWKLGIGAWAFIHMFAANGPLCLSTMPSSFM
jgi:hypothetical protein